MHSTNEGLTAADVALLGKAYRTAEVETGQTEAGAEYAVAIVGHGEDGPITRTLCRERGTVALLDEKGAVLAEGLSVEEVLAA